MISKMFERHSFIENTYVQSIVIVNQLDDHEERQFPQWRTYLHAYIENTELWKQSRINQY